MKTLTLSARSVSGHSGAIVLGGGAGGNVTVTGKLNASAGRQAKATNGGTIAITGHSVTPATFGLPRFYTNSRPTC